MIHLWKATDLEITDSENHHDQTSSCETIPSQTSKLEHVEIINVSDKPTSDT